MMNYKIKYQAYERYEEGAIVDATFRANSDRDALVVVANECLCWGPRKDSTMEEIVEDMHSCNGDGGDFIFYVKNVDSDTILFEEEDQYSEGEEDWGDCEPEYDEDEDEED